MLNAVLYIVENGCNWRSLPKEYGDWHVIYVRVNRWAKKMEWALWKKWATVHRENTRRMEYQTSYGRRIWVDNPVHLLMDRAYEGDETRALALELGYMPVVPPKRNRKNPWSYDEQLYKQRNQVESLFRRIKRFRRIFTRYDKLNVVFLAFVYFALNIDVFIWTKPTKRSG